MLIFLRVTVLLACLLIAGGFAFSEDSSIKETQKQSGLSEKISPEDQEIIENLALLENLEVLQNEDVSFLEDYPSAEQMPADQGENK